MAKNFDNIETTRTNRAFAQLQEAQAEQETQEVQEKPVAQEKHERKERKRYSEEEAARLLATRKNGRGLGGVKSPRINMAFTPANYDFIVTMSRMRGESMTDFVNHLVEISKDVFKDQYETAKKLKESF